MRKSTAIRVDQPNYGVGRSENGLFQIASHFSYFGCQMGVSHGTTSSFRMSRLANITDQADTQF